MLDAELELQLALLARLQIETPHELAILLRGDLLQAASLVPTSFSAGVSRLTSDLLVREYGNGSLNTSAFRVFLLFVNCDENGKSTRRPLLVSPVFSGVNDSRACRVDRDAVVGAELQFELLARHPRF